LAKRPRNSAAARADAILIAGAGFVAPWITGAGVKLFLDAHGQPTYGWVAFLHPGRLLVAFVGTIVWASPFLALALASSWARQRPRRWLTSGDFRVIAFGGLLFGLWGEINLFVQIFWQWDPIVLFAGFLVAPQYVPHMLTGMAVGALAAAGRRMLANLHVRFGHR